MVGLYTSSRKDTMPISNMAKRKWHVGNKHPLAPRHPTTCHGRWEFGKLGKKNPQKIKKIKKKSEMRNPCNPYDETLRQRVFGLRLHAHGDWLRCKASLLCGRSTSVRLPLGSELPKSTSAPSASLSVMLPVWTSPI